MTVKETLASYLDDGRNSVLWKLDGLGEYDLRRPLTPTGTNLLGLVKHLATVELGYFVVIWGRPYDLDLPWADDDAADNADMWVTADESTQSIFDLYARTRELVDAAIADTDLDATTVVPWWGDDPVSLHRLLVHMIAETHRHCGQADILREGLDGAADLLRRAPNLPGDGYDWSAYVEELDEAARRAAGDGG